MAPDGGVEAWEEKAGQRIPMAGNEDLNRSRAWAGEKQSGVQGISMIEDQRTLMVEER